MGFAERNGFVQKKTIQINYMDNSLRNRLFNVFNKFLEKSSYSSEELEYIIDKLGYIVSSRVNENWYRINDLLQKKDSATPWYMPYEIIELFFEAKVDSRNRHIADGYSELRYDVMSWFQDFAYEINKILEQEKAGYRLLNYKFINIISNEEIEEISNVIHSPYESVSKHFEKALLLYSDRKNPDYENSIKESISAVESMCCIITGVTGSQATLGNMLKKLDDNGISIHPAMKIGFEKLYGYTSDSDGIRHGGIDFINASEEDARYMLVSCSAFVNYLIEKFRKINNK